MTCHQATTFGIRILSPDHLASLILSQVMDLTGFELCNASLLDESTAAAEVRLSPHMLLVANAIVRTQLA